MAETIGSLVDKLCVTNQRIWAAEDIKRKEGASDAEIANATRITNVANKMRNDLIEEIDDLFMDVLEGRKEIKLYKPGSTKMYGQ